MSRTLAEAEAELEQIRNEVIRLQAVNDGLEANIAMLRRALLEAHDEEEK